MIRLMVMDAKEQVGKTIQKLLHEQGDEFQVAAIAHHGETARRLLGEVQPDIIISELNVPQISAVELIAEIRQSGADIPVIILSDTCDYASMRSLWQAGAFDYLHKAKLTATQLIQTLQAAKQEVEQHRKQTLRRLGDQWEKIKMGQAADMNFGSISLPVFAHRYHLVEIEWDRNDPADGDQRWLMGQIAPSSFDQETVIIDDHAVVLIMAETKLDRMLAALEQLMAVSAVKPVITLSDVYDDPSDLMNQFSALEQAHAHHFYAQANAIIKACECGSFTALPIDALDYHSRMWEALKIRDFEELQRVHQELMTFAAEQSIDPQALRDYEVFILDNMEGNERNKGVKPLFAFRSVIAALPGCLNQAALDAQLRQSYEAMAEWYQEETTNHNGKDIADILNYVETHYTQKLTLGSLAQVFGMNESYLSRMFKNQTGKNLIYYINEKRLNKARELLKDPHMMVKEAAYAVGYDDQFYFNKLFKRFFGVSPTEYRKHFHHDE